MNKFSFISKNYISKVISFLIISFLSFGIFYCGNKKSNKQDSHHDHEHKQSSEKSSTSNKNHTSNAKEDSHNHGHSEHKKEEHKSHDEVKKEDIDDSNTKEKALAFSLSVPLQTYYQSALKKTGLELKASLHEIIKTNHKKISYRKVWKSLDKIEEDPQNNKNIVLIYTGRSQLKTQKASGKNANKNDNWNREHLWPQSRGFKKTKKQKTPKTDLHHIYPADKTVNSSRSNKDFDEGGKIHKEAKQNKSDRNSWDPRDEMKGDIARALFYMDTRYEGGDEPDLELVNYDNPKGEKLGKLCVLYKWHLQDSVSQKEIFRNNQIHKIQGNRNPFVDNPKWVEAIWSSKCPQVK